jgi:4-carboxymuconolactone decarboxylase
MPRVPPITGKEDVPAEHHHVVDDVLGVFGRIRGPFSVLLYSPAMASKLLPMVTFNREGTIVEATPRFAAILSAVREREGAYVWAAQVAAAQRAGVPQAMIDLIRAKGTPPHCPSTRPMWSPLCGN